MEKTIQWVQGMMGTRKHWPKFTLDFLSTMSHFSTPPLPHYLSHLPPTVVKSVKAWEDLSEVQTGLCPGELGSLGGSE